MPLTSVSPSTAAPLIALPNLAWVEQKRRNGKVITDYLAAQTAGCYPGRLSRPATTTAARCTP